MGCLLNKESKLNALKDLEEKGFLTGLRVVPWDKLDDLKKYEQKIIVQLNINYGLNLNSLFEVETITPKAGEEFKKESIARLTPIESAFNQIDARRKELGIYEDKVSIGEYNDLMAIEEETKK